MKIILIIQGLIILAGAYYIYALSHDEPATTPAVVEEVLPTVVIPTTTPDVPDSTKDVPTTTAPLPSSGPNDAGMEWPVFEGELEVR